MQLLGVQTGPGWTKSAAAAVAEFVVAAAVEVEVVGAEVEAEAAAEVAAT